MGVLTGDLERDERMMKILRYVAYGILAAMVITITALGITVGVQKGEIKRLKNRVNVQTEAVDIIAAQRDSLAKLDCITVTSQVIIQQKGLVNTTQANLISKTVATYTRDEVLMAIDSLNKLKDKE